MDGIKNPACTISDSKLYCKFRFLLKGIMSYLMVYSNLLPVQLQEVLW